MFFTSLARKECSVVKGFDHRVNIPQRRAGLKQSIHVIWPQVLKPRHVISDISPEAEGQLLVLLAYFPGAADGR
jgi:hypothetical protein